MWQDLEMNKGITMLGASQGTHLWLNQLLKT